MSASSGWRETIVRNPSGGGSRMAIVMGFDIHREQITFDALDDVTGELRRGRIAPADRFGLRRFLASLPAAPVEVALEATTGWRFIVEELVAAGMTAHLAE